jgi:hypothetical protein
VSAAEEFALPPGDPAALKAAGSTLQDVAAPLDALGTGMQHEQAGMATVWHGAGGTAAGTETGTLATITAEKGGKVRAGARAFTTFGAALETAIADVQSIRRQADQAETDARADAARQAQGMPQLERRVLDPGRMSAGQQAAYQQWLSDPENDGVRVEMVKIFTALDAAGGQQGG